MPTTAELLDRAKEKNRIPSDYALAKKLGVVRQRISQIRCGRAIALKDMSAIKLANLLDVEPGYVFASIAAEYAKSPEARDAWTRTADVMIKMGFDRRRTPGQSPTGKERRNA